jgi:two-component system, NarL family, sensor histidine kinase DesK
MITLKSELAARLLGRLPESADRDRARDEVEQVAAVSRQTLKDIREAISGYRRPTLAVEVITARTALASGGIAARDDAELTVLSGTFDPDVEAALAWCLREAVTNVVRHSGATTCYLSLTQRVGAVSLTVRDDGNGHTPAGGRGTQSSPADAVAPSSGLRGMSERLSAVGGTLEVRPDLHPGFSLTATVPSRTPQPVPSPAPGVTSSTV